jgi:ferric-dicitrate binding protein FerR (iron transport regulator)
MKISRALLIKFSRDECSPEEIHAIREWLGEGSWPSLGEGEDVPDEIRQRVWNKLADSIATSRRTKLTTRKWNRTIWGIAAGLLALIGTAILLHHQRSEGKGRTAVYASEAGIAKKIMLSDSSVVFLSPHSTISAVQPFPKDKREIELKGEAIFEVAKDASRPFTVVTGNIHTTALGTSFQVASFPDENDINVVLSYGKVVVKNHSANGRVEQLFLDPGEEIVYDKTTRIMRKTMAPLGEFDYKSDILYFKNAGLKEVVEKLQRYYHIKVEHDALKAADWSLSGEFDYQPLGTVMKTIAYSCNIHYRIHADSLILLPNN